MTEKKEKQYFVWNMTAKGPMPQLWSQDYTLNPNSKKLNTEIRILRKVELDDSTNKLTLDELAKLYPCPDVKQDE